MKPKRLWLLDIKCASFIAKSIVCCCNTWVVGPVSILPFTRNALQVKVKAKHDAVLAQNTKPVAAWVHLAFLQRGLIAKPGLAPQPLLLWVLFQGHGAHGTAVGAAEVDEEEGPWDVSISTESFLGVSSKTSTLLL